MKIIMFALVLVAVACSEAPVTAAPPRDPNVLLDDGSTRVTRVVDGNVRCYVVRSFGGDARIQCLVMP